MVVANKADRLCIPDVRNSGNRAAVFFRAISPASQDLFVAASVQVREALRKFYIMAV
jgi:hypothetical protein